MERLRFSAYHREHFYVDEERGSVRMDAWHMKYAPCIAAPPLLDATSAAGSGDGSVSDGDAAYVEFEIERSDESYIIAGLCLLEIERVDCREVRRLRNTPYACAYSCWDGACARLADDTPERPLGGGHSIVGDRIGLRIEFAPGAARGACTVYKNGACVGVLDDDLPRADARNAAARWHFYVEVGSAGDTVRLVHDATAPPRGAPQWVAPPAARTPGLTPDALAANALDYVRDAAAAQQRDAVLRARVAAARGGVTRGEAADETDSDYDGDALD